MKMTFSLILTLTLALLCLASCTGVRDNKAKAGHLGVLLFITICQLR